MTAPPTSQNPAEFWELLVLYDLVKPKTVLEIGTHEGGTLYWWVKYAAEHSSIASIDDQGLISTGEANKWAPETVTVNCLKGNSSSEEAIRFAKDLGHIDWLFIDGGHSYEQVEEDWSNYSPLVKKGGIIIFHDILPHAPYEGQPCEVDLLWNELKQQGFITDEIIKPHPEWEIGPGIGVLYK